jgi:O-antigen/teichoic acid export membrane protein
MSTLAAIGRVIGFVSQLILGWVLTKDEYGLFGIALAVTALVLQFRFSGLNKLLMQRVEDSGQLASAVTRISFGFNGVLALLIAVCAPQIAAWFGDQRLSPMIVLLSFALPLGVPAQILQSRLSAELRFRELTMCVTASMTIRHTLTIALALLGWGAYSLIWPIVLAGLVELAILWPIVGKPRPLAGAPIRSRDLWQVCGWIILGAMSACLIRRGSHLVVGKMADTATTGSFVFAYTLADAMTLLFTAGVNNVLLPVFARLNEQPQRQGEWFSRLITLLVALVTPCCLLAAFLSPPLIHFLWNGKWDDAITVSQIFVLGLPLLMVIQVSGSLLESRGLWSQSAWIQFFHGVAIIGVSVLGMLVPGWLPTATALAPVVGVSIAVLCFRLLLSGWLTGYVSSLINLDAWRLAQLVLRPAILCVVPAGIALFLSRWGFADRIAFELRSWLLASGLYLILQTVAYRWFYPGIWNEVRRLVAGRGQVTGLRTPDRSASQDVPERSI